MPRTKTRRRSSRDIRPPTATALLIGLTQVDPGGYQGWDGRSGCWGCDDDVAAMRLLLEREGYQVTALLDTAATVAAVTTALQTTAQDARPGDTFFFYYSGHGSRIEDQTSGQAGRDETDGWDETLCLFDGHLRDDMLNETWVSFPAESAIFMLSDCCHSGTNYRALGSPRVEAIDFIRDLNGDARMKASLLHISGCKDEQLSAGMQDGGLFTKVVTHLWDKGLFPGTWDTFHDLIAAELPASQRPQGNLYGKPLALESRRPFLPLHSPAPIASRSVPPAADAFPTLQDLSDATAPRTTRSAATAPEIFFRTSSLDSLGEPGSRDFIRTIQQRLNVFGLYDTGAIDGSPGPFTDWALGEFKIMARTFDEPGIGPRTATALLKDNMHALFPLDTSGNSLAARILRLLQAQNHWFSRHPDCLNLVYLEGIDPDGEKNDDRPNVFNDLRTLIRIQQGRPVLVGAWEGTTEPGRHFTENPMAQAGAARIAFGQYYAWQIGLHNGDHEALRQVAPVPVHRDLNKDYKRTGDQIQTGIFFINQHWGYDNPISNLGKSSAGCLVGRTKSGHREFMRLIKEDARAGASRGYRFTTTILDGTQLP